MKMRRCSAHWLGSDIHLHSPWLLRFCKSNLHVPDVWAAAVGSAAGMADCYPRREGGPFRLHRLLR